MLAEKILGNMRDNDLEKKINKQVVSGDFEWFELEKKRIRKVAGDGTEIGICIPEFLKETNNNTSKIVNSNSSTNSMKIPNPQSKNTKTKNDFDNLEELEI